MSDNEDDWFEAAIDEEEDEPVFSEDFSEAMAAAPTASEADEPVEDLEFDEPYASDIPRIDLGIDGLDDMIQGGVPDRSLMVAIGGPGTGKTTLAAQFLAHGLANGERGVFLSLEESETTQIRGAEAKGWPYSQYIEEGQLVILDLDPVELATRLSSIRDELPYLIKEFGADRVVLDSVSLLELMFESPARRRNQIYDFTQRLKDAGVTTLLTSEADADTPYTSRYGMVEYLTDAVFILRHVRQGSHDSRLAIEIEKIRDTNHSRQTKPYEITNEGITVYDQATLF